MSATIDGIALHATNIDRRRAQRSTAILAAHAEHMARFEVRAEIGEGRLSVADAVDDPRAQRMTVASLIRSQRRWGSSRTARWLRLWGIEEGIREQKRVCDLTARQRDIVRRRA